MSNFIELGKKIYDLKNPREAHRFAVFIARCCLHPQKIQRLEKFFAQSEIFKEISTTFPFFFEQVTRAFFYNRSTIEERIKIVEEHVEFLASTTNESFLRKIYAGEKIPLWKIPLDETLGEMILSICIEPGQRKEGLISVMLRLSSGVPIYQIIFWIARDNFIDGDENFAMWIGAMQGPNVDDAREIIKRITKKCHAYRTKNLILYAAQAVARSLGLKKIFSITNAGYYANNHIRRDRKLKTSFGDFWAECGGTLTSDERFFSLPLTEQRKTFDEIPTHKRAVYRRRFSLLDELDATVSEKLLEFKKDVEK